MHTIERTAPDGILIVDGILMPWRVVLHEPDALGVVAPRYVGAQEVAA